MPARRDVGQLGTGAVRPTCSPHLTAFAFMWSRAQVISIFAAVASRAESLSFQCRWLRGDCQPPSLLPHTHTAPKHVNAAQKPPTTPPTFMDGGL
eukprot:SAG31_NODE_10910_length_1085_cov_1.082150_1_plen_95_part_00